MASRDAPIVIKKVKKVVGGGHHGGAWKVAYADFVTAMMAFFLLMWLINTTSPEQRRGIADYFAPASVSQSTSGSGGILAGTAIGDEGVKSEGAMAFIEQMAPEAPDAQDRDGTEAHNADLSRTSEDALRNELQKREEAAFRLAAESLRQALQDMPELAELSKNILVDQTPEGLRIQIIDQEGRPMFRANATQPTPQAQALLRAVAKVVDQLPNRVTIAGHTSASLTPAAADADWRISAERANAARTILQSAGVDQDRIAQVSGKAAKEPLFPDDPMLAGNRRIAIVLLREAPVLPDDPGL